MRLSKLAFVLGAAVISSAFVVPAGSASPTGNDPCKVLTAEKFSQIIGYTATIDKTASTQASCFYQGPADSGGQFMILTETASGPQADAMLNRRGSAPPPGSGLIGGSYRQESIIFSVSIRSTDQVKLQALVAEIKRNLK
jgi:Flp pilus assembly secretin CpaC